MGYRNRRNLRILYLYSELGPYNYPVFEVLARKFFAEIRVISWDDEKLKPYAPKKINGIVYHRRSQLNSRCILNIAKEFRPDLIYVSGWMDSGYLNAARYCKRQGTPVVVGFDDIWKGTLRQNVGQVVYRLYLKQFYSHAWVAGPRQYEFARKLGFSDENILFDMLSCDLDTFAFRGQRKDRILQKRFLYIGNFRKVKGTDILLDAFRHYRVALSGEWELTCVGQGPMVERVKAEHGVTCYPYLEQKALIQVCHDAGCFVLPSRHEQWGVAVQESAATGLPLILSENVGSKNTFLIDGYNGYSYKANSPTELAGAMTKIESINPGKLAEMGWHSAELARRISPETSAASLVSACHSHSTSIESRK